MKILFVTNEVPFPPDNGVRIVSYNAMRLMHEAGHELALAVLTEETEGVEERFRRAAVLCRDDMALWMRLPSRNRLAVQASALLGRTPFFVERYKVAGFRAKLGALVGAFRPDVVHFDTITLVQYRDLASPGTGTVASINDSNALTLENALADGMYSGWEAAYRSFQYRQVRSYESTVYPPFDAVHVMSDVDAEYLRQLNPSINAVVIANGVGPLVFDVGDRPSQQLDVIFVAKLVGENLANLKKFIDRGWPEVRRERPELRLHIVGKIGLDAEALRRAVSNDQSIVFQGYVENIADAYRDCGIAIAPINKNCGLLNKVIEAMAAGLVVIGFDKSFSGIKEARPNQHFVVARDYQGMGRCIIDLARDGGRRSAIRAAAHEIAKTYYSWPSRQGQYAKLYSDAARNAKREPELRS